MYHYLAIDFGESYVGLSVSNGFLAQPLEVFRYPRCNYSILRAYMLKILGRLRPVVIVIGVPVNEKSRSRIQEIFLSSIFMEEELQKKLVWSNEDYSTKEAIILKKRKRMREDAISASIILRNYFNQLADRIITYE